MNFSQKEKLYLDRKFTELFYPEFHLISQENFPLKLCSGKNINAKRWSTCETLPRTPYKVARCSSIDSVNRKSYKLMFWKQLLSFVEQLQVKVTC